MGSQQIVISYYIREKAVFQLRNFGL